MVRKPNSLKGWQKVQKVQKVLEIPEPLPILQVLSALSALSAFARRQTPLRAALRTLVDELVFKSRQKLRSDGRSRFWGT